MSRLTTITSGLKTSVGESKFTTHALPVAKERSSAVVNRRVSTANLVFKSASTPNILYRPLQTARVT
ncbi:hypothetical protein BGZ67_009767, partial [Mortierella alpina]